LQFETALRACLWTDVIEVAATAVHFLFAVARMDWTVYRSLTVMLSWDGPPLLLHVVDRNNVVCTKYLFAACTTNWCWKSI